jgi:phage shock protein A
METVEGRVEAYDLGLKKDLSHQFNSLESEEKVEAELVELKQRIGETKSAS